MLKVESLHSTIREEETVFWSQYFINSIQSLGQNTSRKKRDRRYVQCIPGTYIVYVLYMHSYNMHVALLCGLLALSSAPPTHL